MRDKGKIIVLISCLFLSFMLGLYGSRLLYFYKTEHKKSKKATNIIEHIKGDSNNNIYFKRNSKNNYVYFSGLMYRILYVTEDSVVMITDESITSLKYGTSSSYENSDLKKWLEDVYLSNLDEAYLKTKEIKLLDKITYSKIGGKKSFVVSDDFWTKDGLVITDKGKLEKTDNYNDLLRVKPVIELKNFKVIGEGTKEEPYLVEQKEVNSLQNVYVGEYIKYNNMDLRVIEKNEYGIKVLAPKLKEKHIFSPTRNVYNTVYWNDIGYYLNTTYINKLNKNDLIESRFYIGEYTDSYKTTYRENGNAYIGLLKIGDYFVNDVPNSFLLTKNENNVYAVSSDKLIHQVEVDQELNIYPVFTLNKNLNIKSGNGYKKNPYIVGD